MSDYEANGKLVLFWKSHWQPKGGNYWTALSTV